ENPRPPQSDSDRTGEPAPAAYPDPEPHQSHDQCRSTENPRTHTPDQPAATPHHQDGYRPGPDGATAAAPHPEPSPPQSTRHTRPSTPQQTAAPETTRSWSLSTCRPSCRGCGE